MNRFHLVIFLSFFILAATGYSQSAPEAETELQWFTNLMEAQHISDSTDKPIFAFFTGSDWCGWCHKLERDVFEKSEFVEWANKNVILVELDFPRRKKLPDALARQNGELQQVFRVTAFPTIWLFYLSKDKVEKKMTISALGSLGYPGGATQGKEARKFIDNANQIMAKKSGG
jgi:protein disulfide-isomerase